MKKIYQKINYLYNNKLFIRLVIISVITIPFIIVIIPLLLGQINFWYDNSRDLLSAWNNLSKLTLIGPTSGIQGIFYGPYWIWLLSFGLIFSKNPSVVTILTATLPYFIIFPFIWFKFSKFFGLKATIIGWVLFIFSSGIIYAGQLWNPYPAPLLTLGAIYLLLTINFKFFSLKDCFLSLLLGFILGLIISFHISFGIGFFFGVSLFLLWNTTQDIITSKKTRKKLILTKLALYCMVSIGMLVSSMPFLLFEFRHGFNQIHVIFDTFTKYGAVVGLKGLTKGQIIGDFFNTFASLTSVPAAIATTLFITMSCLLIVMTKLKKITLTEQDEKIVKLILSLFTGILFIYLTAKNPVWAYHFIGVDIIFLLFISFFMAKITFITKGLTIWAIYILVFNIYIFTTTLNTEKPFIDFQKEIVTTISHDAPKSDYSAIAYSPSIYMYEYSYLFKWLANKELSFDPSQNMNSKIIYLIIPQKMDDKVVDFIHFRAPDNTYVTTQTWITPGGNIIKRVKKH